MGLGRFSICSWLGAALLCIATLASAAPDDDTRAAARSLGTEGVRAFNAGDYATASDKLERAYQLLKAPSLGLWSARALEKLGKLVAANERYLDVTRLPISGGDTAVQKHAQDDAQAELHGLEGRIPTLTIELSGASASDVTVTLDGQTLAGVLVGQRKPVDPGTHHLQATRGVDQQQKDVTVAIGENARASFSFDASGASTVPAAKPAPSGAEATEAAPGSSHSTQRTLGFVSLGVGSAGIAVGVVTGLLASSKRSDLQKKDDCSGNHCLASESSAINGYSTLRTVSSVGFIAGGVLAATGLVLCLTTPKGDSTASALLLTPTGAAFRGVF